MKILFFALGISTLLSCGGKNVTVEEKKEVKIMQFDCTNDYSVEFKQSKHVTGEDSTENLQLTVKHDGKSEKYELEHVQSGSGAKYKTKKGNFIYWEHHGESYFGTEDSTYCNCK